MKTKYQKPCGAVVRLEMDLTVLNGFSTSKDKSRLTINNPVTSIDDTGAEVGEGRTPRPRR